MLLPCLQHCGAARLYLLLVTIIYFTLFAFNVDEEDLHVKRIRLGWVLDIRWTMGKAKVDRLMRIDDWTAQANQDYLDLFNVDKTLENGGKISWRVDHRLDYFSWDEACEYPLPNGYTRKQGSGAELQHLPRE